MYCQVWWYSKVRKQFEHPTNQVFSSGFTQLDFHLSGTSTLTHWRRKPAHLQEEAARQTRSKRQRPGAVNFTFFCAEFPCHWFGIRHLGKTARSVLAFYVAFWCVLAVLVGRNDTRRNLLKNITTIFSSRKQSNFVNWGKNLASKSYISCYMHHTSCADIINNSIFGVAKQDSFLAREIEQPPRLENRSLKRKSKGTDAKIYLKKKDKLVKIRCCLSNSFSWLLSVPFSNEAEKEGERERKMSAETTATRTASRPNNIPRCKNTTLRP